MGDVRLEGRQPWLEGKQRQQSGHHMLQLVGAAGCKVTLPTSLILAASNIIRWDMLLLSYSVE